LRAGSLFAHAINTVKMAQGFARLGHEVTLICREGEHGRVPLGSLRETYALDTPMRWVQVPGKWGRDRAGVDWRFTLRVLPSVLRHRPQLVFARDYIAPAALSRLGIATVAESHAHPGTDTRPFRKMVMASQYDAFRGWVTISQRLADHYALLGVPSDKLWVLPDGVDLPQFTRPPELPLNPFASHPDGHHIVYVGHLYDYKGIPTILDAARHLSSCQFHLVGGWPDDIERQRAAADARQLTNVHFHGLLTQSAVPAYMWHADVLLLPPSARHPSAAWTSPIKLGEYLASRTPVVASDIPALRDWLDDTQAEFFAPDAGDALAAAIRRVVDEPSRRAGLVEAGWQRVQSLSYECRAGEVLRRAGV
jgi:glycosyltransferase involved in cell wall biosynthesis